MSLTVIKIGGGAGIESAPLLDNIATLRAQGHRIVLLHGGSDETNQLSEALGHPPRFVTSVSGHVSRFTDERTLDYFAMATGKINLRLVEGLQKRGVNAVGLHGVDGRLLEGTRKDHVKAVVDGKKMILRGDFTGTVEKVNTHLLNLMLDNGYLPVVTVPAISYEGDAVNADGDRAAAAVAAALKADNLVILSNVPGLLKDIQDPSSLVRHVPAAEFERYEQFAQGRFKKKMMGAKEALDGGVRRVILATANVAQPLSRALAGEGTVIGQPVAVPVAGVA
ncbi:MAG TPA: [LysW]-aminoadipate kinase [Candidatus Thermoplasmatota archaeon]|nr:[LysW]-aminoadipate kinase [Candidatus Thermoplasmatota archaeon]